MLSVINVQPVIERGFQYVFHVEPPLIVVYPVISAGKTDVEFAIAVYNRIMDLWLGGEWKREDSIMSESLPVFRDAIAVGSKYVIEQSCFIDEAIEIRRIFFVPERGWDASGLAVFDQLGEFFAHRLFIRGNLVLPTAVVSSPGRLDQQHVQIMIFQNL